MQKKFVPILSIEPNISKEVRKVKRNGQLKTEVTPAIKLSVTRLVKRRQTRP
jgi:hypothetical protein